MLVTLSFVIHVGLSHMTGASWRLLLVHYEDIILPSVTDYARREKLRMVYGILVEIQAIAYAHPKIQKFKQVRLRLHVLCFVFGLLLQQTHPSLKTDGEGMLYIHSILTHFASWYEVDDFRNASTEPGEGFLAKIKRIVLRYSSRRSEDALLQVF